jgi:hypothetical protein
MATKKKLKKMMRGLVASLPMVMQETHEVHRVKGEVLLEQGHDAEEVKPEAIYMQQMSVLIAFNHEKRLQAAYSKGGRNGVTEYIKLIRKIVEHDTASKNP